jgi:hypothetical protein
MANITVNEVRRRLQVFAKEHANDSDEKQHAQQFWRDFYMCFGLSKSSASMFEARVVKLGGERGYIDSFIPSLLLVEQKSLGKDLQAAYEQAQSYFHAIKEESEKPRYIVTCDFQTFNLYDLHDTQKEAFTCKLDELHKRADWFMFLADKKLETITEESPINRKAAYQVSLLHEALLLAKFGGRDLEVFLTRLLFCFFADDTAIFGENGQFKRLLESTREDGRDTGAILAELFQVLNQPHAERQTTLDEALAAFEYINGSLFAEQTRIPSFNFELRKQLIECNLLDWSDISPAIFGAMFQGVLEAHTPDAATRTETRRELGAHYTSERNILRVINPLFLNALREEYEAVKKNKTKLQLLYNKLPTLKFFDPACGCGNFLVIAFRELRRLENDVIGSLFGDTQRGLLDVSTLCQVNVSQFYGIEIDEASAHIARVAMWITDHQLNIEAAVRFGTTRPTVPLISSPHIACGNALRINWNDVLPAEQCSYVMGNPPFYGKQWQTKEQKLDMELVANKVNNYGVLDYVCGWYIKAAEYISNSSISVAFVSTNSITQGQQVAVLWPYLLQKNIVINFAHRTFKWSNEGKGVAAVHCVIVGFSLFNSAKKVIYAYTNGIDNEPLENRVKTINPYLVETNFVVIEGKRQPICNVKNIAFGSMPNDGGYLLLNDVEKNALISKYPATKQWIRKFIGGEEFINNVNRWCLWLVDAKPDELSLVPDVYERLLKVKETRINSTRPTTQKLSSTPSLFGEIRQPNTNYLAVPEVSSERRIYIPIAFTTPDVIASNKIYTISNATLYDFGILTSTMHMAWMRTVCGRLKSDYQYSAGIVYNNFIWAIKATNEQMIEVDKTAQAILDARALHPTSSLAALYDPLTMPVELVKAHEANNKAVDRAYGYKGNDDDASRVAFLFKLYEQLTSLLPSQPTKKTRVKTSK